MKFLLPVIFTALVAASAADAQQGTSDPSQDGVFQGRAAPGPRPSAPTHVEPTQWQTIQGTVDQVKGTMLELIADNGKPITVDIAQVDPNIRSSLTKRARVTVGGFYEGDAHHLSARVLQEDRSASASPPTERTK